MTGEPTRNQKQVKHELKLKQRLYREIMGIALRISHTRIDYDHVVTQMAQHNSLSLVSRNTNVPIYFIKKWLSGKGIPPMDILTSDEDGSAEVKRKAIEVFYETGNALAAVGPGAGKNAAMVERWVLHFQRLVDERENNAT